MLAGRRTSNTKLYRLVLSPPPLAPMLWVASMLFAIPVTVAIVPVSVFELPSVVDEDHAGALPRMTRSVPRVALPN